MLIIRTIAIILFLMQLSLLYPLSPYEVVLHMSQTEKDVSVVSAALRTLTYILHSPSHILPQVLQHIDKQLVVVVDSLMNDSSWELRDNAVEFTAGFFYQVLQFLTSSLLFIEFPDIGGLPIFSQQQTPSDILQSYAISKNFPSLVFQRISDADGFVRSTAALTLKVCAVLNYYGNLLYPYINQFSHLLAGVCD